MPQPRIDSDAIRQLAQLLEETGLTEVELKEGDRSIRVVRNGVAHATAPTVLPAAPQATAPSSAPAPSEAEDSHAGAVTSPMVGTIYLAPGPGEPPFVTVGMQVAEGATLFIVEAMKVMNPILAPRAGTVTRILVSDAQPVEFGEPLLILE